MKKGWKRVIFCAMVAALFWFGSVIADRQALRENLIRLHVVANSDSQADQAIKLRVRDAIVESLREEMAKLRDMDAAKAYLQEKLPKIQRIANQVLAAAGVDESAVVTLCREAFDIRHYDTFSLPSGVYESLRITIGAGEGKNWWCVVFPSLCIPATSEEFEDVAVGAGFSEELTDALEGKDKIEIRFFLLDLLGKMENIFFRG